jgi:hypothetical protein
VICCAIAFADRQNKKTMELKFLRSGNELAEEIYNPFNVRGKGDPEIRRR